MTGQPGVLGYRKARTRGMVGLMKQESGHGNRLEEVR